MKVRLYLRLRLVNIYIQIYVKSVLKSDDDDDGGWRIY